MEECEPKPAMRGEEASSAASSFSMVFLPVPRGAHSSTFQLNVSAFCGIGSAIRGCGLFRGCVGGVMGD